MAGIFNGLRFTDQGDNFINMADGNPQGFQDVEALLAFAQLELAPAPDHIQTVFGVNPQRLFQGKFMRRSVHQSQQV